MSVGDTVGIAGAGAFGTALANLLAKRGRRVILWSRDADVVRSINGDHVNEARLPGVVLSADLHATADPEELASRARFLVIAVASTQVRERVRELGDVTDGSHLAVHAIGAFASPGDVRVTDVMREEMPVKRIGTLAGPALSRDLAQGAFASMVCASTYDEVGAEARRLLGAPPVLRVYQGRDVIGAELASALAGAYTCAIGLADGMNVGPGPRAVLVTRAVAEASRLGEAAGAHPRTFFGLAGLGNLLIRSAAGAGAPSRDYQFGRALAEGAGIPEHTEGARAALAGARLAERRGVHAPVLRALAAVLTGKLSPEKAAAAAGDSVALEE
jgi:glycerol-3-phosphate dehydrogenase (NAD(P)+)